MAELMVWFWPSVKEAILNSNRSKISSPIPVNLDYNVHIVLKFFVEITRLFRLKWPAITRWGCVGCVCSWFERISVNISGIVDVFCRYFCPSCCTTGTAWSVTFASPCPLFWNLSPPSASSNDLVTSRERRRFFVSRDGKVMAL